MKRSAMKTAVNVHKITLPLTLAEESKIRLTIVLPLNLRRALESKKRFDLTQQLDFYLILRFLYYD